MRRRLSEVTPASSQGFPIVADPFSLQTEPQIEERVLGNPNLHPEVAYEWTYGAVYSPKWVKGLTVSADWWHIDMRDIVTALGAQTIIQENPPPDRGASTVVGAGGGTVVRGAGLIPDRAWASPVCHRSRATTFQARSSKVSTTKRSIFWIRRSSAAAIGAG